MDILRSARTHYQVGLAGVAVNFIHIRSEGVRVHLHQGARRLTLHVQLLLLHALGKFAAAVGDCTPAAASRVLEVARGEALHVGLALLVIIVVM